MRTRMRQPGLPIVRTIPCWLVAIRVLPKSGTMLFGVSATIPLSIFIIRDAYSHPDDPFGHSSCAIAVAGPAGEFGPGFSVWASAPGEMQLIAPISGSKIILLVVHVE